MGALWGACTDDSSSCCGDAVCSKEADYTACVPPADLTNSPTSKPTTPEPTPPNCTICDDKETSFQIKNGFDCATDTVRMNKKCNKDAKWTQKGWCRLSATMQAMGTRETCVVMRLSWIGRICVDAKVREDFGEPWLDETSTYQMREHCATFDKYSFFNTFCQPMLLFADATARRLITVMITSL